ncbi:hypothetical protein WI61_24880 [Burkholderia cepacia]|nr:hypothetical protein WI48_24850 [Burkholderia cepacia]KVA61526.1 hypothetical protein WI47_33385 [Burkholderia cepacia]KVA65012.1 hypothetical protein WI49_16875 [Burkholderia cepacia]KVA87270.1 hypothetical protein WI51_16670 [Burkholderia cepacia]KVA89416.1 hypothetical protein WI50_11360 [Burkholderia cepacia]
MAMHAVSSRGISIRLACESFGISQACYRYVGRRSSENDEIANWLLRLTDNHRNWGFGLCFLYLRNVEGFGWNHKRMCRIYRELELNLRIKPRKRLVRQIPEPLAVPRAVNQVWSMYFMHGQLADGRGGFNRTVRYEWLSQYHWEDLDHVQRFATDWMWNYNHDRPHMALGGFTPKQRLAMAA